VKRNIFDADVTIATSYSTVLPALLYGSGQKYWFAMHYEPLFAADLESPKEAAFDSRAAFDMGIPIIANSLWLKTKIQKETTAKISGVCPNAIDHNVFYGEVNKQPLAKEVKVISYGGRGATWKGFAELAEAVAIVRRRLPDTRLRWLVYGDALLPPDNNVAEYESLGHVKQVELGDKYRECDILLSASWYESFPLFPLEAMACGLPVIATLYGAEDFVIPQQTAAVVGPRDVASIASELERLITDQSYRIGIATKGFEIAKKFTWHNASRRLSDIIFKS
jgi:glycosyltransferase involved in cell wall biosynthesis